MSEPTPTCPICNSRRFKKQRGRELARCIRCMSLERHRTFWVIADMMGVFHDGAKIMHLAPERWMVFHTDVRKRCDYRAFDIEVARYAKWPIKAERIDLCTDLPSLPENEFDIIIHNHVIEHLACDLGPVMAEFRRILKPGGRMFFSMPIQGGKKTIEDFGEMTPQQRKRRFGQDNHMRLFGRLDAETILHEWLGEGLTVDADWFMHRFGAPRRPVNGHTIFLYTKP